MTERLAGLDPDPLTVATYDAGWDAGYEQATRDGSPRFLAVVLVALVAGAVGFLLAWSIASPAAAARPATSEVLAASAMAGDGSSAASLVPGASRPQVGTRRLEPPAVEPIRPPAAPHPASRSGTASWYQARGLIAAAGPALRHGHWRGSTVVVQSAGRSVTVRLTDWCQCYGSRVIDLSDDAFARLAPLSRGLIHVTVAAPGPASTIPPTDAGGQHP